MRILALQGGGIRGLITAVICEEIERKLGCPIARKFDLIAGTSAGSIVGAGLATGASASEVVEMFRTIGKASVK